MGHALGRLTLSVVALALAGCGAAGSDSTTVPDVIGRPADAASDALDRAELSADLVDVPSRDDKCRVVSQRPKPGAELETFSEVRLRCVSPSPAPQNAANRSQTAVTLAVTLG